MKVVEYMTEGSFDDGRIEKSKNVKIGFLHCKELIEMAI